MDDVTSWVLGRGCPVAEGVQIRQPALVSRKNVWRVGYRVRNCRPPTWFVGRLG